MPPPFDLAPEVVLVYKKSRLALYAHERKNARFEALLARKDEMARAFTEAHEAHTHTLAEVKKALAAAKISYRTRYRASLQAEDTEGKWVITVGGDGTLLDASHRIRHAPVLGVNSDPDRSVGFLCAAQARNFTEVLDALLHGELSPQAVPRLDAALDDVPIAFPILNDVLVAHKNPAATTRYALSFHDVHEVQKSSGIWLAGPAGSTAAIASAGGAIQALDDTRLQVRVREPYVADQHPHQLEHFFVPRGHQVEVVSRMREGVIYLDGPHQRVAFPLGAVLRIGVGDVPLRLVVTADMLERRKNMRARLARRARPEESP